MKATLSDAFMDQGQYANLQEYQSLKESREREIAATRELYEHLKAQHGPEVARRVLEAKGYNPALVD